ncbi:cellulose biosynthesis cyclic di-GMP-binding regulatory protein BcsB [Oceanicella sp. SM1341]|uniref:cellulose biosynthesis cyclic di-GMP-binding regulatory protein BcsB n=1 Tax=Oceanicella sp. SM1341 TaxID=1548889 RepID=UPI000E526BD9|nr:cellulose biosynthesis cyclic di-GMP-binding regulatory protein BcsB [Oceanicella sp. SM1341]
MKSPVLRSLAATLVCLSPLAGAGPLGAQDLIPLPAPQQPQPQRPGAPAAPAAPAQPLPEIEPGDILDRSLTAQMSQRRGRAPAPAALGKLAPLSARDTGPGLQRLYRMDGELGRAEFSMLLPEVPADARLRLATLSTVDLLPERSGAAVSVNGTPVGEVVLDNFSNTGRDELPLPDGVLKPGRNTVSVDLTQTHRIYCGPEASFSLWTSFDLASSGVTYRPTPGEVTFTEFLSDVSLDSLAGRPLVVQSYGADPQRQSAMLLQLANYIGSGSPGGVPRFQFRTGWPMDLPTGSRARITILQGDAPGYNLRLAGDGATVLVLVLGPDGAAPDISGLLPRSLAGGDALPEPVIIEPGVETSFEALGYGEIQDRQHFYSVTKPLRLPSGWMLETDEPVVIKLDYNASPFLPAESRLLVRVNGNPVRYLPLDDPQALDDSVSIRFPARYLHGASNALTFDFFVPGEPADRTCAPITEPLARIAATSSILVPEAPEFRVFPALESYFTPNAAGHERLRLDPGASDDLAGMMALVASSAHGGMDLLGRDMLAEQAPDAGQGAPAATLAIVTPGALGGLDWDDGIVPREMVAHAFQRDRLVTAQRDFSSALPPLLSEEGLDARWELFVLKLGALVGRPEVPLQEWLHSYRPLGVLVEMGSPDAPKIYAVAEADDRAAEFAGYLSATGLENRPAGRVSVLTQDGRWHSWSEGPRIYFTGEPTFGGMLAVAGNYASRFPGYFILLSLILAAVSALVAYRFVTTRRKR